MSFIGEPRPFEEISSEPVDLECCTPNTFSASVSVVMSLSRTLHSAENEKSIAKYLELILHFAFSKIIKVKLKVFGKTSDLCTLLLNINRW